MEGNHYEDIFVDFGTVYCDSKPTKFVKIKNNSSIDQIFVIEKNWDRPRLDSGFNIIPIRSLPVKPGDECIFTVKFIPNTVNIRCCDSFTIKHLYGTQAVLVTKATVRGPECSISCSKLQIFCPHDEKKSAKKFYLSNIGKCCTDFHFLVDVNQPLISVQPNQGSILPTKQIQITVIYTPVNNEPYFKRIFCLISNQEPLFLDVHAVWLKSNENLKLRIEDNTLPTYVSGYHRFFHDVMKYISKDEVPLASMEKPYIDFGHCQAKSRKQIEFSVTNNYNCKLSVTWHQGLFTKEFKIQPTVAEIEANNCATFSVIFKPSVRDKLFGSILEAQVFSNDGFVPFPMEINLKGDSFEELSCGWAAQYSVEPNSVVLPPCVPSSLCPSHSTLTIFRKGHLPLAFCFHPPPLTNFCVKPQQGLIYGNFQIVVVQYHPRTMYDAIDTEKWLLSFNSNESVNQCFVEFGCSIETPRVILNYGHDIDFPAIHPGTEHTLLVDLFNPTRFSFWYKLELITEENVLSIEEPTGELWPHEHRRVPMVFHPQGPGLLQSQVICTPILEPEVAGRSTMAYVTACSCETRLTVVPEKLLLLKVIRDFHHKRVVDITNSGDSVIKGSFLWELQESSNIEDIEITFLPETFYLKPGNSLKVEITITPLTIGVKNVIISYSTSCSNSSPLLTVTVDCIYPVLQITDLRITNSGPLFIKMHYWKMMQINKLNEMLYNVHPGRTSELEMNLPSFVCISKPTVELLIENNSELAMHLSICSLVSCHCQPVKKQVNFSTSKWDYNCPHKNQVELEPSYMDVQAGSYVILKMKISYKTVGEVESHFLFNFTPENYEELTCSLKIRVVRTSIPEHTAFVDTTEPKENGDLVFNMRSVYIGDINPIAQGYMMYNNTKMPVQFEIDDEKLWGTPFKYIGEKNQITSLSNHSLLFTFLPYSCITYEAVVTLTVNNKMQKLILRGSGVSSPGKVHEGEMYFAKKDKLNKISPLQLYSSTPHIYIGPIKPKCTMRNVFFLKNNTKDLISFIFLRTKLSEVVQICVQPAKGIIQPGERIQCRMSCYSRGWPCYLTVALGCIYANFSQYAATVQDLNRYYNDLVTSLNHFVITEQGSQTINVPPPLENWPAKCYLAIGVTIDIRDQSVMFDEDILPICPRVVESKRDDLLEIDEETTLLISVELERLLWQVLNKTYQNIQVRNSCSELCYKQIKNLEIQTNVEVPDNITQTILEDILFSTWQELFDLPRRHSSEHLRCHLINQLQLDSRLTRHSSSGIPTLSSISESFTSMWSERLSSKIS